MRHRFHAICPYFAMFPESFVEKHLAASKFDGYVFDPFCGRGTTVFESLLRGRNAAGCDVHPVAACITGAKCNSPSQRKLVARIEQLESEYVPGPGEVLSGDMQSFFAMCFHRDTLEQVRYLRDRLNWQKSNSDRFIAALCLGALHGESHRSPNYFSNRMPRTIATKPGYSVRWWNKHGYQPPARCVFEILKRMVDFRYTTPPPTTRGRVVKGDARYIGRKFATLANKVSDVITSPPYLDTTNYREDQWLRLWFLGDAATCRYERKDGRHNDKIKYWDFLKESWAGLAPLLADEARIVVRIGGRKLQKDEILTSLHSTLEAGLDRRVRVVDGGITSPIKRTQANSFRGAKATPTVEHDFCFLTS